MTDNEKAYFQLRRQIERIVDWDMIDNTFKPRFLEWWKLFEPYVVKNLIYAEFVKKGNFKLEEWLSGGRKEFYSNLQSLFRAEMKNWIHYEALLPLKLGGIKDDFDIQEYCQSAKRQIEKGHLKAALDKVFYVPLHAAALVMETEWRTQLLEKCKDECEKRGLKKYQTPSRNIKYEIAKAIGMQVGSLDMFKSGKSREYHRVSKMLSELHYHKKRNNLNI